MESENKFTLLFTLCETLKSEILFFKPTETIEACGYTPYDKVMTKLWWNCDDFMINLWLFENRAPGFQKFQKSRNPV